MCDAFAQSSGDRISDGSGRWDANSGVGSSDFLTCIPDSEVAACLEILDLCFGELFGEGLARGCERGEHRRLNTWRVDASTRGGEEGIALRDSSGLGRFLDDEPRRFGAGALHSIEGRTGDADVVDDPALPATRLAEAVRWVLVEREAGTRLAPDEREALLKLL